MTISLYLSIFIRFFFLQTFRFLRIIFFLSVFTFFCISHNIQLVTVSERWNVQCTKVRELSIGIGKRENMKYFVLNDKISSLEFNLIYNVFRKVYVQMCTSASFAYYVRSCTWIHFSLYQQVQYIPTTGYTLSSSNFFFLLTSTSSSYFGVCNVNKTYNLSFFLLLLLV